MSDDTYPLPEAEVEILGVRYRVRAITLLEALEVEGAAPIADDPDAGTGTRRRPLASARETSARQTVELVARGLVEPRLSPEQLLARPAGVGVKLAQRIRELSGMTEGFTPAASGTAS